MYWILCGFYSGPDKPSKEKEDYKPSKEVTRENEGAQLNIYLYNIK